LLTGQRADEPLQNSFFALPGDRNVNAAGLHYPAFAGRLWRIRPAWPVPSRRAAPDTYARLLRFDPFTSFLNSRDLHVEKSRYQVPLLPARKLA
jgi:hypothetical protein